MSREGTDVEVIAQQDDEVTVADGEPAGVGALKLLVLGRLKNSARKDRTDSPGREKFLNTDASYWRYRSEFSVYARTCP
jgi:hypothetical protein